MVYIVDASAESGLVIRTVPAEGEMVSKKTSTIYLYIKDDGAASSSGHFSGGAVGLQEDEEEDDE